MGSITESFANLSEFLIAERKKSKRRGSETELLLSHVLKPLLPSGIRCGTGTLTDIKDRQAGPLDVVGTLESFPPFGEGSASIFLADGALFCLQVRNWAENDLSQFGELARQIKKLERKRKPPVSCLAVSYEPLPLSELSQFLNGKSGQSVDGILCIGSHFILRNSQGWYGDPQRVPFVTEQPGPEALKSFTFFLLQQSQTALGLPFGLTDYQHL